MSKHLAFLAFSPLEIQAEDVSRKMNYLKEIFELLTEIKAITVHPNMHEHRIIL